MTSSGQSARRVLAIATAAATLAVGCSSDNDADQQLEQERAAALVEATQAAGVAPRLTTDVAESLYGADAAAVCEVFEGGLGTSARNVILGNAAQGRRTTVTDEAVVYGRLVVQTYCPDELDHYDDVVADLDPWERTDR